MDQAGYLLKNTKEQGDNYRSLCYTVHTKNLHTPLYLYRQQRKLAINLPQADSEQEHGTVVRQEI